MRNKLDATLNAILLVADEKQKPLSPTEVVAGFTYYENNVLLCAALIKAVVYLVTGANYVFSVKAEFPDLSASEDCL